MSMPTWRCSSSTSRIAWSSIWRSCSSGSWPWLYAAWASLTAGGRRKLPTWSARKGGFAIVPPDRKIAQTTRSVAELVNRAGVGGAHDCHVRREGDDTRACIDPALSLRHGVDQHGDV